MMAKPQSPQSRMAKHLHQYELVELVPLLLPFYRQYTILTQKSYTLFVTLASKVDFECDFCN